MNSPTSAVGPAEPSSVTIVGHSKLIYGMPCLDGRLPNEKPTSCLYGSWPSSPPGRRLLSCPTCCSPVRSWRVPNPLIR